LVSLLLFNVAAVVQADPADLDAARSLLADHRYDQALAAVDRYLGQHPKDPVATIVKTEIYAARGEWDRSVAALEEALAQHENNVELLLALAVTYRDKMMRSGMFGRMSNAKKSSRTLEKAFATDPNHLPTRRQMVMYLVHAPGFAGGDKDRAEEIARGSLEIDEFEGRYQLATVLWKKDQRDAAIDEYRLALELVPDDVDALLMLCQALIEQKEFAACEKQCLDFIAHSPARPEPYQGLGDCYSEQKKTDEAIAQYLAALERDGWYGDARYKVARLYEKKRDKEQAAYHYRILIERNPGYVDVGNAKKQLRKIEKGR
jgi:tetratricopeptide (TPR) repeat protein